MKQSFRSLVESMFGVTHDLHTVHNQDIHQAIDSPATSHHIDLPHLVKSHLTSTSALDSASVHHDPEVRRSALQSDSPHLNMSHVHAGLKDSHPLNRIQAIHTSKRVGNLASEHLHTALQDHDVGVQKAALSHPNINKAHIDTAMKSSHPEIRHMAAMHHAATPQHVISHINNPETSQAHKIETINRAPGMHQNGLHGLLKHSDGAVQHAAHEALKTRTMPNAYHPLHS